jgi:N-hydroxyarylamine O-acetyltransferase
MDIDAYLKRIEYGGSLEPTAETLRSLHRAHLFAVPFENLDIPLGRPIILKESRLFDKIVNQHRGGFCYELNGCFAGLLRGLGFKVELLSAGVARKDGGFDPPFDHMALLVDLEDRWLADVGFGDCFVEPLLLDEPEEQVQEAGSYKILRQGTHRVLVRLEGDRWAPQYRFTLGGYGLSDFDEMCHYHQTSPESIFTQKRTCSRAMARGRITLTGMRLITTASLDRRERELSGVDLYGSLLRETFGIELGHVDLERLVSESAIEDGT